MNPNRPNVTLRDAASTDDIFIWYFVCVVPKEGATKLPKLQISTLRHSSQNSKVTIWKQTCSMIFVLVTAKRNNFLNFLTDLSYWIFYLTLSWWFYKTVSVCIWEDRVYSVFFASISSLCCSKSHGKAVKFEIQRVLWSLLWNAVSKIQYKNIISKWNNSSALVWCIWI